MPGDGRTNNKWGGYCPLSTQVDDGGWRRDCGVPSVLFNSVVGLSVGGWMGTMTMRAECRYWLYLVPRQRTVAAWLIASN